MPSLLVNLNSFVYINAMNLTTKQRAYLRSEAQTLDPIVMVGKDGYTDGVKIALQDALEHHEMVKVRFQNHKDEVKEIAHTLSEETDSVLVTIVGFTAVFFKQKRDRAERIYII